MSTRDRESLARAVARSRSLRQSLAVLGLSPAGGNYESLKKAIAKLGLDTSHFTGMGYLKGKTHSYRKRPLEQVLTQGKLENTFRLRNRLLAEGRKQRVCERCGLSEWLGGPIPLELHHKDGDRTNNVLSNLALMCPNCHALTDNYRGKNKKV
jgi:hypothetical protein